MTNLHDEKVVEDPVIHGGIYTPFDPITGSVGEETGDLVVDPTVGSSENAADDDTATRRKEMQENTPGPPHGRPSAGI